MIKCEVVEDFRLQDFKKLKNLVRKNIDVEGKLYIGDTFECDEKMAEYLTGKNVLKKVVVKIIEVQPEKNEDYLIEDATIEYTDEETKPKATIKKTSKNKIKKSKGVF